MDNSPSIHNTFFIADTHFGHDAMRRLRLENKTGGFSCQTLAEMDQMLIDNWNSVVGEHDTVIVAGDFIWNDKDFENIFKKLHGVKHLVRGNHDTRKSAKSALWASVSDILHLRLGNEGNSPKRERVDMYVCHYPMRNWNGLFHGSFHIYGHTHCNDMRDCREFNVGVDVSIKPFFPHKASDILAAMEARWYPKRNTGQITDKSKIMAAFARDYGKKFDPMEAMKLPE